MLNVQFFPVPVVQIQTFPVQSSDLLMSLVNKLAATTPRYTAGVKALSVKSERPSSLPNNVNDNKRLLNQIKIQQGSIKARFSQIGNHSKINQTFPSRNEEKITETSVSVTTDAGNQTINHELRQLDVKTEAKAAATTRDPYSIKEGDESPLMLNRSASKGKNPTLTHSMNKRKKIGTISLNTNDNFFPSNPLKSEEMIVASKYRAARDLKEKERKLVALPKSLMIMPKLHLPAREMP